MKKNHLVNQNSDIISEACAWIAQIETGSLTPADVHALKEWMQRSPRHTQEIKRLARLSAELNVLSDLQPALGEAAEYYRPVRRHSGGWWCTFLRSRYLGTMASVLLIAMFFLSRGLFLSQTPTHIETSVGGYLEQTLADGSVVQLNTDTRIDIDYDDNQRQIFLRQGEAFFQVAHNPDRPFMVHVNDKTIRAVGTAFAIRLNGAQNDNQEIMVTVTEGAVQLQTQVPSKVSKEQAGAGDDGGKMKPLVANADKEAPVVHAVLRAGQRLILPAMEIAPKIDSINQDEIRQSLSWRDGFFEFSETPLEEVIQEFDRYTDINIEIADPALRMRKFTGIFPIGDLDTLVETLQTAYGIEVTYEDAMTVRMELPPQG